ncbi:MAG: carboxypeptidase-like regulatory domain-containing protein [Acidobacteriota bacterium]
MTKLRGSKFICLFVLAALAVTLPSIQLRAQSQASTGIIEGTVQDQTGAVLPGVTLSLRQTESNFERVLVTDDSGRFRARLLPVGPYLLTAELAGFKQYRRGLLLTVAATVSVLVPMQLG